MKVIKVKDYNELSKVACEIFVEEIKKSFINIRPSYWKYTNWGYIKI